MPNASTLGPVANTRLFSYATCALRIQCLLKSCGLQSLINALRGNLSTGPYMEGLPTNQD